MPTGHREELKNTANNQITITRHPDGCLLIYPQPAWERFSQRVAALPATAQWWKRLFFGAAQVTELDGTGRVLISPELRQAAGLEKELKLLGMGDYFELWNASQHDANEGPGLEQQAGQLPADFGY